MAAAGLKRARAFLSALLVFVAAALAVPILALAQGTHRRPWRGGGRGRTGR